MSPPWNAPSAQPEGRTFQVTHPFHPLTGKTLELIAVRHNWGVDQAYYYDAAGRLRTLPVTWTSLSVEDPVTVVAAGRAPFKLADLLELARLLEQFRQPDPKPPGGVK